MAEPIQSEEVWTAAGSARNSGDPRFTIRFDSGKTPPPETAVAIGTVERSSKRSNIQIFMTIGRPVG